MPDNPLVPSPTVALPVPGGGSPTLPLAALAELRGAMARLSRGPGLVSRFAELLGSALGGAGRMVAGMVARRLGTTVLAGAMRLAPGMEARMAGVAQTALARAFEVAVLGLAGDGVGAKAGDARTAEAKVSRASTGGARIGGTRTGGTGAKVLVAASGAAGGAAGLAGFAPDAAVTTLAIMRRIARIAQEEGEDLAQEDARRACLEVFALRSGAPGGNQDSGYFPTRLLLQGGPLMRLLAEVAARYGVQLGQKLAAQAVPVAGAVCGAALNAAFMGEYEGLARAHFTIRRLERTYGTAAVHFADFR